MIKNIKMPIDDTALITLMDLGIKRDRAEKALAASGNRCPIKAMEWLISHVKDPHLDTDQLKREYTLVAVPIGAFGEELTNFWRDSKMCSRLPHIPIVDFFMVPANMDLQLKDAVIRTVSEVNEFKRHSIRLKKEEKAGLYVAYNLEESDIQFCRRIGNKFIENVQIILPPEISQPKLSGLLSTSKTELPCSTSGGSVEPKEFHMILPYGRPNRAPVKQEIKQNKCVNAQKIDATEWELRLYSRDKRLYSNEYKNQIFRAHCAHKAHNICGFSFSVGDYISATAEEVEIGTKDKTSLEQMVWGVSITTGSKGYFPLNCVDRVSESDCWTLHVNIPFGSDKNDENIVRSPNIHQEPNSLEDCAREFIESEKRIISWDHTLGKVFPVLKSTQKVFIMRHGERVDYTFPEWTKHCISSAGYQRLDLNLPTELPNRTHEINARHTWKQDSPLTNQGWNQARLTGDMLKQSNISIEYVYCSPAFRCIQTAAAVLEGLKAPKSVKIRIEPALFEWCNSIRKLPTFLTYEELLLARYNIDNSYVPVVRVQDLKQETLPELYERNNKISEKLNKIRGNTLIVGHAVNLETNSQPLLGSKPIFHVEKLRELMKKISYVSMVTLEKINQQWAVSPYTLPLTHGRNFQFDWISFTDRF